MLSGRLIQVTVLLVSVHAAFVSPSPAPAESVHAPMHKPRALGPRQDIPPGAAKPVYHLPPVDEVFKMVADAESRNAPAAASHAQAPAPMIAAALIPVPTTTTQAPPEATYHGPGLVQVVPTSVADPELTSPPTDSAGSPVAQPTTNGPAKGTSTPARQLILIGIVMGVLVVLVFLVYVLLDRRVFAACSRRKKDDSEGSWTKINSPPSSPSSYESEKDVILYTPPMDLSSASSSSQASRDSAGGPHTPPVGRMPARESKVIDISHNYPGSKFSVTSSDYPYSLVSSTRSSAPSPDGPHSATSPLLPAYEFFCLPSNSECSEDNRHSRARSVPVFGHAMSQERPDVMVRSWEHRRSRSVSGLTYTVMPHGRQESGSSGSSGLSAGDWRGSPHSDHGWPSAL